MPNSEQELKAAFVGLQDYRLSPVSETVARADWDKLSWRIPFLCQRRSIDLFFVHLDDNGPDSYLISFGTARLS